MKSNSSAEPAPLPFPPRRAYETVDLTEFFLGPDRFALRVGTGALPGEGILAQDVVIVCTRAASDGELVVAARGNDVILGRVYHDRSGTLTLYSGPGDLPRKLETDNLVGVVVAQFRSYG